MAQDAGAALPKEEKGSWTSFLKSISTFSGDLYSLTAPSFILSPTSLAEFPSYWGEPSSLFADIAKGKTPEDRAIKVLRWFLATLKGQFTTRETQTGSEKKPLNPILGELFLGHWDNGALVLTTEQVSHHPPVTAYFLEHKAAGVTLQGHCAQKTSFSSGQIVVKQVGHALLKVQIANSEDETFLITLPTLKIEGLWYGSPYIELSETSYIQSSTGILSTIEYKGKGYFSGKSHSFKAVVTGGVKSHTIEGQWTGQATYSTGAVFSDFTASYSPITVKPIEDQHEYESRKVWMLVAEGIRNSDFEKASREKSRIENEQRMKRKEELANGTTWQLKYFDKVDNHSEYVQLAAKFKFQPQSEESYVYRR